MTLIACGANQASVVPASVDDGTASGLLGGGALPPGSFDPGATPLRRLTAQQYRNSLADLLGPPMTLPDELEPDVEVDGFLALGAARTVPSARGVDLYASAAYRAAHEALLPGGAREKLVGCAPASAADLDCAREFVVRFGRRAFRRPLDEMETARYADLFAGAAAVLEDFYRSLEYVVAAMLQSPNFLYRAEIGRADPLDPSRRLLDPFELAGRLSFFAQNTTPDDELLDAAESGELESDEGLSRQSERLLRSPRAKDAQDELFSELFQLGRLDNLPQLPSYYPAMTPTFGDSARREMLALVLDITFSRDADYRELFDTTRAFLNPETAALYQAPASADTQPATLPPERAGMFARAAFLALNGHASSTSPTKRGKFVREVVLCEVVAPPPPNVNVALRTDAPSPVPRTLREELATHSVNPVCAGCHAALDPVGLGLEQFDGVGALRTVEAGRPVDSGGRFGDQSFAGAAELGAIVKRQRELGPCLVRNVVRYATGRLETDGDMPVLAALSRHFEAHGARFLGLVATTIESASFRYAGEPE